jgi:hypothetical protein
MIIGRIVGLAAALGIAALIAMNWADVKRYMKIESM